MGPTGINLYGIAHVKVDIIADKKMHIIPTLGRFVWTTTFVQCEFLQIVKNQIQIIPAISI